MKSLQVTSPTTYEILDLPIPTPGANEVLMRVSAVTTCPQWDLHLRHNEPMFVGHKFVYPYQPGQPGHEAVGVIEAVGAEVKTLRPGQRVCAWRDQGHDIPGCYAQYVILKEGNAIPVPEHLPDQALASLELAMCIGTPFRGLKQIDALNGKRVGVSGLGPAGLVALQMALAEGAVSVIGFDMNAERRALALKLGAEACYDPTAPLPESLLSQPLDTSIDCVGRKSSLEFLLDHTFDTVALFGVQRENYTYQPKHNHVTLQGYKGHFYESAEYALAHIVSGKLNLSALVTHCLPLEDYGKGIDLLETQQAIKICFLPWA